ncbi:MAG: UMP kinase [Candidatus Harrisonbacteria bacterium]|nr:UMP kinase [Candidatus Harrisonbacteria bacterium]
MIKKDSDRERIILSLGGSLIVPDGGINIQFLKDFNAFIRRRLKENPRRQFFIVAGGGRLARHYRDAGHEVIGHKLTNEDMDWLGIHATRLNAHLLRTIFRDIAHPYIIKHYDIIRKVEEPVAIAAGWKPGWSTDYDAVLLAEDYHAESVVNLSNIDRVYDKDPRLVPDAHPIETIGWSAYRKIVGKTWVPGMNAPFDPVASERAESLGLKVVVLKGDNWKNLERYFNGEKFVGTVIGGL